MIHHHGVRRDLENAHAAKLRPVIYMPAARHGMWCTHGAGAQPFKIRSSIFKTSLLCSLVAECRQMQCAARMALRNGASQADVHVPRSMCAVKELPASPFNDYKINSKQAMPTKKQMLPPPNKQNPKITAQNRRTLRISFGKLPSSQLRMGSTVLVPCKGVARVQAGTSHSCHQRGLLACFQARAMLL